MRGEDLSVHDSEENEVMAPVSQTHINMKFVDDLFDQWYRQDENLGLLTNQKVTRMKNAEFRKKMQYWKKL